MKRIFILVLCAAFAFSARATSGDEHNNAGILYGPDNWFSITAPTDWVLDNKSGVNQGLHAVFYPVGGSWQKSPAVMYAKAAVKEGKSFDEFVEWDTKYFKDNEPSLVLRAAEIDMLPGKRMRSQRMNYGINKEIIVYIDEPKTVTELVMTARSDKAYDKSIVAFKELVKSYKFLGTKVEMK